MLTDSCTTRPTPASVAAWTSVAEPSVRTRSLSRHDLARMNCVMGGMAEARLTIASCPATAVASDDRSKMETGTGSAPRRVSVAALVGVRASAETVCPSPTRAGTTCPPIAPVAPVTNTFIATTICAGVASRQSEKRDLLASPAEARRDLLEGRLLGVADRLSVLTVRIRHLVGERDDEAPVVVDLLGSRLLLQEADGVAEMLQPMLLELVDRVVARVVALG